MTVLCDLAKQYGTDKGARVNNGWDYTPIYHSHLENRRNSVKKVLEVGICGYRDIPNNVVGASLFMWKDYFHAAEIHGLDNDGRFIFNDQQRIFTALADAYDSTQLGNALRDWGLPQFDVIIDDAVHDPLPQIDLALMLWPSLKPGGFYAIEDVCPCKCMHNKLDSMVRPLMLAYSDMTVDEFATHKDERLLILKKAP